MRFIKWLIVGTVRDMRLRRLKADFRRDFPEERMAGSLDGYCGIGIMIGREAVQAPGRQPVQSRLEDVYTSNLVAEQARHRDYARRAYRIGIESVRGTEAGTR